MITTTLVWTWICKKYFKMKNEPYKLLKIPMRIKNQIMGMFIIFSSRDEKIVYPGAWTGQILVYPWLSDPAFMCSFNIGCIGCK